MYSVELNQEPNPLEDATDLTTAQILGLTALQCVDDKSLKPLFWSLLEEHTYRVDSDVKTVYFSNLEYGLQIFTMKAESDYESDYLKIYFFKNGFEPMGEREVSWDDIEYLS